MTPDLVSDDPSVIYVTNRKAAYCRVFDTESRDVLFVLADLAKFCRAHSTPFGKTTEETHILIGRHEVWLRLQEHLNLSSAELWSLYGGRLQK